MTAQPDRTIDTSRPFTRAEALTAGIARRLRTNEFRRLFHGIYVAASTEVTPVLRAEAALLPFGPEAWASHATAARIHGLPIPALPGEHVTVIHARERRSREGVVCHYADDGSIQTIGGVRVSAPQQVFVELATLLPLVEMVVVGDHMVRRRLVALDDLKEFCASAVGAGAALARRAVAYVRERVDSPMETRLRMLIVLAGLPEPVVNELVGDGLAFRKYDLSYRRSKTIVEYDGRQHAERIEQWESDLDRREAIDDDEWRILVVIAKGIYKTPGETLARIHRVLLRRGEPGVPLRLSDDWRPHFPGQD